MCAGNNMHDVYRAGQALVSVKTSPRAEAWENFKSTNPVMQRLSSLHAAYEESESPLVTPLRAVTSTIGSWFEENETAQVTRMIRAMDPNFSRETFEKELREYIIPEVVDAYLSADRESLVRWCSEAVCVCDRSLISKAKSPPFLDLQCSLGDHGTISPPGPSE